MSTIVPLAPAWLRGGARPQHVAGAVILGAVAGAVGGWNLTFALLVTLALLHNGPLLTAVAAGLAGCAAAHIGSNLTTAIGSFFSEKVGLGAVIESLGHSPLVALFGLHDYQLLGSALLALVLSLPAAHAMARRCRTSKPDDESEPAPAALRRPWGIMAASVWLTATAATLHVAAPQRVGEALLAQLSAAAQAPIAADRIHYDLFTGSLQLDGLRIRDLDEPGRIALRVDTLSAEVQPGLLLRGRLHVENVALTGLTYDAVPHSSVPPKLFASEQPTVLREGGAVETPIADPTQPLEVTGFVRNWSDATLRLSALGRLIAAVESTADLEAGHAAVAQRVQAVRRPALEPRDAITGRSLPLVQIKKLRVSGLPTAWSLGDDAYLELVHATSRPATSPRSVQLTLDAPKQHLQLSIGFRLTSAERRHEAALTCDSCPTGDLIDLRRAAAVGLETAAAPTLALRGRGTVGRDRMELSLACDVVGLQPAASAVRFGNLDAAVWRAGIERLGGLRFDATLTGRWNDPHVQLIPIAAVDQLKHQLRSVGEHTLVKAVEAGRFPPPIVAPPAAIAAKTETTPEKKSEVKPETKLATAPPTSAVAKPETPAASNVAEAAKPVKPVEPTATKPLTSAMPAPIATTPATTTASTATPPMVTPSLPLAPAALPAPPTSTTTAIPSTAPSTTVTPASAIGSIADLRQPASVLDPSAVPGPLNWKTGTTDPFAAAAERVRIEPRRPPIAVPAGAAPVSTGPAVIISDEMKPNEKATSQTSLVNKWFAAKEPTPNPAAIVASQPTITEPAPSSQPEQTVAAKPWFPRMRRFLGEELPETPESTQPQQTELFIEPAPQTAKAPWYDRMFR